MMLDGLITVLFAGSGLAAGYLLALFIPEEIPVGKKYFFWLKNLFLAVFLVLAAVLFLLEKHYVYVTILVLISGLIFYLHWKKQLLALELTTYGLFFLILLLQLSSTFFPVLAAVIFLYGLPAGSLLAARRKDGAQKKQNQ